MLNNQNFTERELSGKIPQRSGGIDPMLVLSLIIKNWYYFAIAIVICLALARFYIGHTMPVFRSNATILIKEIGSSSVTNNNEILQGLGLPGGMRNLENQMMILTSRELTQKALEELPFEVEYYYKTFRNQIPLYPDPPIRIIQDKELSLPRDVEFSLRLSGNNRYILESKSENYIFVKQSVFGETVETSSGSFRIELRDAGWFIRNGESEIFFIFYSKSGLTNYYNNRLSLELLSRGGSLVSISVDGTNRAKDVDFLNKLAEVFQSISLDKKNIEALRRIQFIDNQLIGISDSLSTTENKLQQFRSNNMVMDLSAQGQAIIAQVTLLENEKARLNLEANYYDYLAEYLAKDVSGEVPIVPITMGITDPSLTRLVEELATHQQQMLNKGVGEMNPLQNLAAQRIKRTKEALMETLNGLRRANSLARSENELQLNKVNKQATALPYTERQLLGIERKFKLNNELYTFLLETRANQQMQKASNVADCEIVDHADEHFSSIVSPNPVLINFAAIMAGSGIPFIIIFLSFIFNKKIKEEDIKRLTDMSVVGNIPHCKEDIKRIVFNNPNSSVSEAFRLLRSRIPFFTKETVSPVILITSSIPDEGKTFISVNLASIYSLLGKKTIIVGFDLRKPKIHEDFDLINESGISTWLIGKDRLDDIIQKTSFENLDIITSGPIPPNPSELIAMEKTNLLFKELKERYDYIIVDSAPIALVSDTFHLASMVDTCILVVRPGKTLRDMLEVTLKEISNSRFKNVCMVINDIKSGSKNYNYGGKYGYTDDKKSKRFRYFKRKKEVQK